MFKQIVLGAFASAMAIGVAASASAAPLTLPENYEIGPSLLFAPADADVVGNATSFNIEALSPISEVQAIEALVMAADLPITSTLDVDLEINNATVNEPLYMGNLFDPTVSLGYGFENQTVSFVFDSTFADNSFAIPDFLLVTVTSDDIAPLITALEGGPVGDYAFDADLDIFGITVNPVDPGTEIPAPGTAILFLTGVAGVWAARKRKQR